MFAGIIKWKLGAEHIFVRLVFVERARMERMSLQRKSLALAVSERAWRLPVASVYFWDSLPMLAGIM